MPTPSTPFTTLISVEQLQALRASGAPLKVFDCTSELMNPEAADRLYAQVHIAGAMQAHLDRNLSAPSAADAVNGGRHPLPRRELFAEWLRDTGFDNTMQAVVYDRNGASYCGRLWWMLKWAGHEAVAVLDGGLQAWEAAGGAVESGAPAKPEVGHFTLSAEKTTLATTPTVAANLGRPAQTIVDARATPRFRGEMEPLDPVAGHIPGALNRPFGLNLGPDGRFQGASRAESRIRGAAGWPRPGNRRPPLRQRRHRRAQPAGHGNRRAGPRGPVRGQLERVVQHARPAVRARLIPP